MRGRTLPAEPSKQILDRSVRSGEGNDTMSMRIGITITNQDGQTTVRPMGVEAALPETEDLLAHGEQALTGLKEAIRAALV